MITNYFLARFPFNQFHRNNVEYGYLTCSLSQIIKVDGVRFWVFYWVLKSFFRNIFFVMKTKFRKPYPSSFRDRPSPQTLNDTMPCVQTAFYTILGSQPKQSIYGPSSTHRKKRKVSIYVTRPKLLSLLWRSTQKMCTTVCTSASRILIRREAAVRNNQKRKYKPN